MIRKMIFGAAAAVAMVVGFGASTANAAPPVVIQPTINGGYLPGPAAYHPPRVDYDYIVMIQRHGCWERYGRYDTFDQARRVEWRLERDGFVPAGYGYPLVRAGVRIVGEGEAGTLVIVCDDLFRTAIGAACGGPAEDTSNASGPAWPLVDRFEAAPGRWVSVYREG